MHVRQIVRFARKHRLLHKLRAGACKESIHYVTEYGAMRIIAHFRAIQGEWYLNGKDFHRVRDRQAATAQRALLRRAARNAT